MHTWLEQNSVAGHAYCSNQPGVSKGGWGIRPSQNPPIQNGVLFMLNLCTASRQRFFFFFIARTLCCPFLDFRIHVVSKRLIQKHPPFRMCVHDRGTELTIADSGGEFIKVSVSLHRSDV